MTTPEDIAQKSAEVLWQGDEASRSLGITMEHVGPGTAVLTMEVTPTMVNGHGLCHGGYIFLLADSAFAFACNSYNQRAVAQHNTITYIESAHTGERLTATAVERSRTGRNGIYDVTVTRNQASGDKTVIAELRGHSRTLAGILFAE